MSSPFETRAVQWLALAGENIATFPLPIRARIAAELVYVQRHGPSPSWLPVRGVPSVVAYVAKTQPRPGAPYRLYWVLGTLPLNEIVILHAFEREERRPDAPIPQRHLAFVRARLEDVLLDRQQSRSNESCRAEALAGSANPFVDIGFPAEDAAALLERATIVSDLRAVARRAPMNSRDAAVRQILAADILSVCPHAARTALTVAQGRPAGADY